MILRARILSALVAVTILVLSTGAAAATTAKNSWTAVAPVPTPRGDLVAVSAKSQVFAIGGEDNTANFTNRVELYSPTSKLWTTGPAMSLARANLVGVLGKDGRIYAIGGRGAPAGVTVALDSAEAYNPTSKTWTTIASMPTARYAMGGALGRDGRIYLMGGYSNGVVTNSGLAYNSSTNKWTPIAAMPTTRYLLTAAASAAGRIYAFGGVDPSGNNLDTVEAYDPKTGIWTVLGPMPQRMSAMSAVVFKDTIYVIGGRTCCAALTSVWAYSPSNDTWKAEAPMPTGRFGLGVTRLNSRLYALGGYMFDSKGQFQPLSAAEVYRPQGTV